MTRFVGTPLRGIEFANAGDEAFSARILSDSVPRVRIDAGGRITWSSGSVTGDVTLYRDEANVLKTDDTFKAPALFVDGIEIDTTGAQSNQVLQFNGTKFAPATSSSGASVTVADTAPSSPSQGDLWFESDTARTYVYYDSYWVEIGSSAFSTAAVSASAPQNPRLGDLWFSSVDGGLYVYYDLSWIETGAATSTDSVINTIAAKGDIVIATSPATVERLGVGANGQALIADSSTATGLKWGDVSSSGDSDQIVIATRMFT